MRSLANQTYHQVIIDDGQDIEVKKAIFLAKNNKIMKIKQEIFTNQTLCLRFKSIKSGVDKGKEIPYHDYANCPHHSQTNLIQDSLIIGKYLF